VQTEIEDDGIARLEHVYDFLHVVKRVGNWCRDRLSSMLMQYRSSQSRSIRTAKPFGLSRVDR
jgi:hypothetical protein